MSRKLQMTNKEIAEQLDISEKAEIHKNEIEPIYLLHYDTI